MSGCTASFFSICRGNHSLILPYLSFIFAAGILVKSDHTFLLYLLQESLSNRTISFFDICRGNPCKIVPCLSSIFAAKNPCQTRWYRTFFLFLPQESFSYSTVAFLYIFGLFAEGNLSNFTVPFFYIFRGNPWQIVPYFSSSVADLDPHPDPDPYVFGPPGSTS